MKICISSSYYHLSIYFQCLDENLYQFQTSYMLIYFQGLERYFYWFRALSSSNLFSMFKQTCIRSIHPHLSKNCQCLDGDLYPFQSLYFQCLDEPLIWITDTLVFLIFIFIPRTSTTMSKTVKWLFCFTCLHRHASMSGDWYRYFMWCCREASITCRWWTGTARPSLWWSSPSPNAWSSHGSMVSTPVCLFMDLFKKKSPSPKKFLVLFFQNVFFSNFCFVGCGQLPSPKFFTPPPPSPPPPPPKKRWTPTRNWDSGTLEMYDLFTGLNRFFKDIELMIGSKPNIIWKVLWGGVTPATILVSDWTPSSILTQYSFYLTCVKAL